jgi:hypothetical protein
MQEMQEYRGKSHDLGDTYTKNPLNPELYAH